jgi:aspartyl-tRNA(Asn)/glutamyl-tRNA(Gln) amidotransferase subunit A
MTAEGGEAQPVPAVADALRTAFSGWRRQRTAEEWCQWLLREIGKRNPDVNAFSHVYADDALQAARQMDVARGSGRPWGALHGVPVAVKDNIAVKGWPLTGSSKVLAQQRADGDATVITRLRHSGAVLLGQTVMHELAFGMTSINPHLGAVRNPWDPTRICGGSSGGSAAAVAAGLAPLALGSDTGGSIRCPAALCGITGFKPSFGAVSRQGVLPLGGSLDTVGPLARSAAECLAAFQALQGEDPEDEATWGATGAARPAPASLAGLRIGLPRPYFDGAMEEGVRQQVNLAVERLQRAGARVENVAFPDLDAINAVASIALLAEAASFFQSHLAQGASIGEDVRGRFEQGLLVPAVDWVNAQRLRARWKREVAAIFQQWDLLLTPASPVVAPRIDDPYTLMGGQRVDARTAISRYLRSFNFLGLPALVLPCGLDAARLPVAVQFVSPGFTDEWLLQVGVLAEAALEFTATPPGVLRMDG